LPAVDHSLFYSVSFHRNRTETLTASSANDDGAWVITDADRGIDIGQIAGRADRPASRELRNIKVIVRRATPQEVASIPAKEARETDALQLCQAKVRELELPMEVTGAEFQFDGKKLTFYYSATRYVDFRNLVRILFRIFGTRIWMVWYDGNAPVRDVLTRRDE
jgi:cell fate regulator YaaT (PSP1 superfamily)